MTSAISGATRLLGLMGHPARHTLSPGMHNASFAAEGLDYVYVAMEVAPEDLKDAVRGAVAMGFLGFNLTMPHKEAATQHLDSIDGAARVSCAVNTVVIDEEDRLLGYNTDGAGMLSACREAGVRVEGGRTVLLGAGGAAAAIAFALREEGAREILVVNRNPSRAEELLERLRISGGKTDVEALRPDALSEVLPGADVVVNATSLGMNDGDPLPFDVERLPDHAAVCDAVYRPGDRTALVAAAEGRGLRVVSGERMLLYQGVAAQRLWTGFEPNVAAMDEALTLR